jgi:hypothetical protein
MKKPPRPEPKHPDSLLPVRPTRAIQPAPPAALLEAYKKHVEELRKIEDRHNNTIAVLLGIFSAGGTLLLKQAEPLNQASHLDWHTKLYISVVAFALAFLGRHAINELHDLRIAVRELLVRCEVALRFYEVGRFLQGDMLYTDYEKEYARGKKGRWTKQTYWIVWLVCAAFLLMLWRDCRHMLVILVIILGGLFAWFIWQDLLRPNVKGKKSTIGPEMRVH